jgi:hypothetical protein
MPQYLNGSVLDYSQNGSNQILTSALSSRTICKPALCSDESYHQLRLCVFGPRTYGDANASGGLCRAILLLVAPAYCWPFGGHCGAAGLRTARLGPIAYSLAAGTGEFHPPATGNPELDLPTAWGE